MASIAWKLSIADLTLVHAIAEEGSLSRAAARLNYSQPTASHHLASLERRVGGRIAHRNGRGTALTELGAVVAGHAVRMLDEMRVIEREVERHVERGALTFRMGTFPSAGAALLAPALTRLRDSGFETIVTEAETPELQAALRSGDLHAIVAYHNPGAAFTPRDDVEVAPLMADEAVILMPEQHPLAHSRELRLSDLNDATWASGADDTDVLHFMFLHSCWAQGFEPRIAYRVNDYVMIQSLVRQGLCVAVVPRLGTFAMVDGVVARPIAGQRITRLLFYAFRRSVAQVASAAALAELRAAVGAMAAAGIDVEP
jgi:DNA-binding transcriptional LysR family regulator